MTEDAKQYSDLIRFMLTEPTFENVDKNLLRGIKRTISITNTVTPKQKKTVNDMYIRYSL